MNSAMRAWAGALIILGILVVTLTFGWSWAVAADTSVDYQSTESNTDTLIGVQGPARGGNVSLYNRPGALAWRYSGAIISYQDVSALDPQEVATLERTTGVELSNETVLATFTNDGYRTCNGDGRCVRTGIRLLDPVPRPHVVYEWSYGIETRKDSEAHDVEVLPSGELLVADMEYESIFTVDLSTGARTWTWNASSFYEAHPDPTSTDWLHINDVDHIGDGRYLISVRNANQLLVVERGEGVVEIINEDDDSVPDTECAQRSRLYDADGDGDVRCGDPAILDEQHNPDWLGPGAVLVADSENDRVVELHRNRTTGRWEVAWAVSETGGIHFDWPRDADRLPNGTTLVTDSRNNRVVEITRNGNLLASYATEPLPYEADRIPYEEQTDLPYRGEVMTDVGSQREIPGFSTVTAGVRHVVALPHWVSGLHVLALSVAMVCWISGLALLVRDARR